MTRYRYATTGFPLEYPDRLAAVRRMIWRRMGWRDKLRFLSMSREQFRYLLRQRRARSAK